MKQHSDGLWITDLMEGPHAYLRRALDLDPQVAFAKSHRSCVQAGGHIGIYPKILGNRFQRVYTFEPERENFACLARNADADNIYAARAFLGDHAGCRALRRSAGSSGGHQTGAVGEVPTWCVDSLQLADLDAMFIDVEGFEWWVLQGALDTIARCRPLLVLEENKKLVNYGRRFGDLTALVAPFGYALVARIGEDIVLQCVGGKP